MTEQEMEWLEHHFPKGFIITVMQPACVLTLMSNPEELVGIDMLNEVVEEAKEIIADDGTPVVIEKPTIGD